MNLQTEITKCLDRGLPTDDLVRLVAKASLIAEDPDLKSICILVREEDLAPLAMAALPGWGEAGIEKLVEFSFDEDLKLKTRTRAIESAISVSQGLVPTSVDIQWLPPLWDDCKKYEINDGISKYCMFALKDRLLNALEDDFGRSSFFLLLGVKAMQYLAQPERARMQIDILLSFVLDSQLVLSSSVINKFGQVMNNPKNEEVLQKLFTEHPVLLDPFVNELFTKQQLGSDFITDFVIKRTNSQYVLVEIESCTDKLFNQNGSFSSNLMEAIAQVRDFQAWVSDTYARKKLPEIKHPEGLVVIGRSSSLNDIEKRRLAEENHSRRGHIKIVTYDELLDTAKSVHRNIIEKPVVRTSKETKSI